MFVWHKKLSDGHAARNEVGCKKEHVYWSVNLDAYVNPEGPNCHGYLVWWQDANDGKGDYFEAGDPRLKKRQLNYERREHGSTGDQPPVGSDCGVSNTDNRNDRSVQPHMAPAPVDGGDRQLPNQLPRDYGIQQPNQRGLTFAQVMNNMNRRTHAYLEAQDAIHQRYGTTATEYTLEGERLAPIPTPNLITIPRTDGRERVCIESALRIAILRWTNAVSTYHDRIDLYEAELQTHRISGREYIERTERNHMPVLTTFHLTLDDLNYARTHDWPEYRPLDITRT